MSVDTSHTTALFRAGHRPATLLSARCLLSIAFRVVRTAETNVSTAHSNPISRSSTHNYEILVP